MPFRATPLRGHRWWRLHRALVMAWFYVHMPQVAAATPSAGTTATATTVTRLTTVATPSRGTNDPWSVTLSPSLDAYVASARSLYAESTAKVEELVETVDRFLADPCANTLSDAREAWVRSRIAYGHTEVFRYSGSPIDGVHPHTRRAGPEGRINSWPVDEAYLDYVEGDANAGVIQDLSVPMTVELLSQRNGLSDESEVTLGFHAIEFLLWGQDRDPSGPGDRPCTDYVAGEPVHDRRREALRILCRTLSDDIAYVASEWAERPDSYAHWFRHEIGPTEALARALSGCATLAGFELASERIGVPLASSEQEDEHSCFSDTTHLDYVANIEGLLIVLRDASPGLLEGCSDASETAQLARVRLTRIEQMTFSMPAPIDQVLLSAPEDPRRVLLEALAGELIGLAGELRAIGDAYGVRVVIGG